MLGQSLWLIQSLPEMLEEHAWNHHGSLKAMYQGDIKKPFLINVLATLQHNTDRLHFFVVSKNSMDWFWPFLDIMPPCDTHNKWVLLLLLKWHVFVWCGSYRKVIKNNCWGLIYDNRIAQTEKMNFLITCNSVIGVRHEIASSWEYKTILVITCIP